MKLLFMRHGESKSQAKLVQNSDPDILNQFIEQKTKFQEQWFKHEIIR